jgi:hypothetical protein
MTLQLLHSEFPYIRGKFSFLFYQCNVQVKRVLSELLAEHWGEMISQTNSATVSSRYTQLFQVNNPLIHRIRMVTIMTKVVIVSVKCF